MSSEQVWLRFEAKKKDGTVVKLRIQDIPPNKLKDALDLYMNYFVRDEAVHRALGISNYPEVVEGFRKFHEHSMSDPSYRMVICCSDDTEDVTDLMGFSAMSLTTDIFAWIEETSASAGSLMPEEAKQQVPQVAKTLLAIVADYMTTYNPVTEFNLSSYFDDKSIVVDPAYRGLGIAEHFLKVRRLMCKANNVQMTGAWMTAFGTQKAGARDGWETVKEVECDYLAKKYGVTFVDVPPTFKFMIARIDTAGATKKLIELYESKK